MNFKYLVLITYMFCSISYAQDFEQNSDITDQINAELKKNKKVIIPAGNYKIDAVKSIKPQNGSIITMSKNTLLNIIPNGKSTYRVFNISNVQNVKISGGQLIGDKYSHLNKKGEWGMGIDIRDSQNINISDMKISKMWGDAIYMGTNYTGNPNNQVYLNNIQMNDNRRQGLTIVTAKNLYASNLQISNTTGTSPANGIDIEPNDAKAFLDNLNFTNIKTSNNKGSGFQVSLTKFNNSQKKVSINLDNHTDNGSYFGLIINGINNPNTLGNINISNSNYIKNRHSNYCFNNFSNNKLLINLNDITQDNKNNFNTSKFCMNYIKKSNIKIKNNLIKSSN